MMLISKHFDCLYQNVRIFAYIRSVGLDSQSWPLLFIGRTFECPESIGIAGYSLYWQFSTIFYRYYSKMSFGKKSTMRNTWGRRFPKRISSTRFRSSTRSPVTSTSSTTGTSGTSQYSKNLPQENTSWNGCAARVTIIAISKSPSQVFYQPRRLVMFY